MKNNSNNPFSLYDRNYKSMNEEINGIFIRHSTHPQIEIYELYHECVRKYEHLFIDYKHNILKHFKSKIAYDNNTFEEEELTIMNNLNKYILKQKDLLDKLFDEIKWFYFKMKNEKIIPPFKEYNTSICKATLINSNWKIDINYKSI